MHPDKCTHEWEQVETPVDAPYKWFRCQAGCNAYGFYRQRIMRRQAKKNVKVNTYRCSATKCKGVAVQRVPGRGSRGAFLWTCVEHTGVKDD